MNAAKVFQFIVIVGVLLAAGLVDWPATAAALDSSSYPGLQVILVASSGQKGMTGTTGQSGVGPAFADFQEGYAAYERQEYAKALEIFQPLAGSGDAAAQNMLGKMYGLGQGVPKDEEQAVKWFTQSARNGNPEAQETLAVNAMKEFYEKGGDMEHPEEKIQWIKSSAERGNPEAMNIIGMLHSSGNGLPMSTIEAEKWYCRAIKRGHRTAARNLGLMMAGTFYYLERVKKVGESIPPPCSNVD